jgi:hypothetical protein
METPWEKTLLGIIYSGRIILKQNLMKQDVDWIGLIQDRFQ